MHPDDGFKVGGKDLESREIRRLMGQATVTEKSKSFRPSPALLAELAKAVENAWKTGVIRRGWIAFLQNLEEWFKKSPHLGPEQDNAIANGPRPDVGEKPGPGQNNSKPGSEEEEPEEPEKNNPQSEEENGKPGSKEEEPEELEKNKPRSEEENRGTEVSGDAVAEAIAEATNAMSRMKMYRSLTPRPMEGFAGFATTPQFYAT